MRFNAFCIASLAMLPPVSATSELDGGLPSFGGKVPSNYKFRNFVDKAVLLPRTVNGSNNSIRGDNHHEGGRHLEGVTAAECFSECVKQQMTAAQCERYIQQVLGPEGSEHVFNNVEIEISAPRPTSVKQNSYYYVGVPVNVEGQSKCDMYGGNVQYNDPWETDSGTFQIPPVSCTGLNADECCNKFHASLEANSIPNVDKNGNCLECWTHQEPLKPYTNGAGELVYEFPHSLTEGGECVVGEMSRATVNSIDTGVEQALATLSQEISSILERNRSSCSELGTLQRKLQLWARSKARAMAQIPTLLCGLCADRNTETAFDLDPDTIATLDYIFKNIGGEVNSDVSELIIFTDHQGYVIDPPTIGGSREDIVAGPEYTDCEGEPAPVVDPPTFSDGTPIPADSPGVCDAMALSEQSGDGEPCKACRTCLKKECDWEAGSQCKKILRGVEPGSPEDWLGCLASQGISNTAEAGVKDHGFDDWCTCALKCERKCLKQDMTKTKVPHDRRCDSFDMARRSADETEKCHDCRLCLQEECSEEWGSTSWCYELLHGIRSANPEKWYACLESNGTTKFYTGPENFDDPDDPFKGTRDGWAKCARRCDDRCEEARTTTLVTPGSGPICHYNDLAGHSGAGEYCEGCRKCMKRKCHYWMDNCEKLLTGELQGTGDNWNWCLNNCGRGLVLDGTRMLRAGMNNEDDNSRQLTTDDGQGTPRSTWCSCARDCDNSCYYPEDAATAESVWG